MNLIFSLEDDSSEVNIDIDEDSINIEIKNIEDEIEETDEKIEAIFNVIDNLTNVRNHIKKFGITKEFLHLINTNNRLGSAIGLTLPYYESESENLDQIDEDELPDVEVVVEAIDEKNKSFFASIKNTFKKMIDSFNNMWYKLKDSFTSLEIKVKEELDILKNKKESCSKEQLKAINIKFVSVNKFRELWSNIIDGLNTANSIVIKTNIDGDKGGKKAYDLGVPRKDLNKCLAYIGKELINEGQKINYQDMAKPSLILEENNLLNLQWNEEEVIKFLEKGFPTKAAMARMVNEIQDFLMDSLKEVQNFYNKHDINYFQEEDYHNLVFSLRNIMRAYIDLFETALFYIKQIISIGRKLH